MVHDSPQLPAADPASAGGTTRPKDLKSVGRIRAGIPALLLGLASPELGGAQLCRSNILPCLEKLCVKTSVLSNLSFTEPLLQAQSNMQGRSEVWVFFFSHSGKVIWLASSWHLIPSLLHECIWVFAFFF